MVEAAFWMNPDWSGGDNLRSGARPFWMLDGKPEVRHRLPTGPVGVPICYGRTFVGGNIIIRTAHGDAEIPRSDYDPALHVLRNGLDEADL